MSYLQKIQRNIKFNGKKQKIFNSKSLLALGLLGIAIGGTAVVLFTKNCYKEIKNIVIKNIENNDENTNIYEENTGEDINIIRDEIKETLERTGEESLGNVGVAIEDALEDLEDVSKDES